MSLHRTLAGSVVTALLALGPVAVTAPAGAALPDREISAKVVEKRNKLIFKGKVKPDYANKKVIIQKRNCLKKKCKWHQHDTVKTNKKGGFNSRITAPRKGYDYWRAKVNKQGDYGTSYSEVWRTYTI
jgi:hypothetical protein